MGVEALSHRDDGSEVAIPESREDWQQWVSAGRTRNWMLNDPLIDWLRLYGKDHEFIPREERENYVEDLDFLKFIFERDQQFEAGILLLLKEQHEVAQIAHDYRDVGQLDRAEETFAAMQSGSPIIYQAVLWDAEHLNYGSPDFLVRSDVLRELFPNVISAEEASIRARDLGNGHWHYRVVDTKFATLHFNSAGTQLDNGGSRPAYKAQLYIYNRMLGRLQGYLPPESYLLGRGWQIGTGSNARRCGNALARLGHVPQDGTVANDVPIADEVENAVAWIRRLRTHGHRWKLLPTPSVSELYPNMSAVDDEQWALEIGPGERDPGDDPDRPDEHWTGVKRWLAGELNELTLLWQVGFARRKQAHDDGFYRWDAPQFTPAVVGVRGPRTGPTLQQILDVNADDGPSVLPHRIENTRGEWYAAPNVEFFVDFEFCSDLDDDFCQLPDKGGQPLIFMIGCGHVEDNQWQFRSFATNSLTEREEIRIIREWVEHMETVTRRLDPDNPQPRIYHWTHAEVTQLESAYNSARVRQGENANWPLLGWYDFQTRVMRGEPVTVRGAFGFGLKAVAQAMHANGLIETNWEESPVDGLGAMVGAWRCNAQAQEAGISMMEIPLMQEIAKYNQVDCRVMMEIVEYLREYH